MQLARMVFLLLCFSGNCVLFAAWLQIELNWHLLSLNLSIGSALGCMHSMSLTWRKAWPFNGSMQASVLRQVVSAFLASCKSTVCPVWVDIQAACPVVAGMASPV
eukprot:1161818-Pelagomonas_calceolata.AAC.1